MMEKTNYTFVTLPGVSRVLRGEGYEYRISKRKDEYTYWICLQKNCRGTAFTVNDDIETAKRGDVDHNHLPDQKVQKKMTDMYKKLKELITRSPGNEENTDDIRKDQNTTEIIQISSDSETENIQETENTQAEKSDNEGNTDGNLTGSDYEHLKKEAKKKNLEVHDIPKDGNCLFHAICDQLRVRKFDRTVDHRQLRSQLVEYIKTHADHFNDFLVNETMEDYRRRMKKDGEWGDHPIIQAFFEKFKITVDITSTSSAFSQTIPPSGENAERTITIGHIPEFHYVSLRQFETDQVNITVNSGASRSNDEQSNSTDSPYSTESDVNVDATGVGEDNDERGEMGDWEGDEEEGGEEESDEEEEGAEGGREGEDEDSEEEESTEGVEDESEEEEEEREEEGEDEGGRDGRAQSSVEPKESQEDNFVDESATESEEESDENTKVDLSKKKSVKFVPMNLYKFKPYPSEMKESAEDIIQRFIDKIAQRYDKKQKATEEMINSRPKKKRRIITNQNEEAERRVNMQNITENEEQSEEDIQISEAEVENEEDIDNVDDGNEDACMYKLKELHLTEDTNRHISGHPSNFKLKLYGLTTPSTSQMARAVSNIVEGSTYDSGNTNHSFFVFFYRDNNGEDPEIYVMTSGHSYRQVEKRACTLFPDKIAKRLLQYKSIEIVTRNVTGDTSQTSKLYLPNSEGTPNIWDLVTAIVNRYTAFPNENSSIYSLNCFQKKNGKPKEVTISIKEKSVMVNKSTSMDDLLDIVNHFALIDQGKPTKLQKGDSSEAEEERDDPQFDQMNYIQRVINRTALKTLNNNLDRRIQRLLKGTDPNEDLTLSFENMREFVHAEKYVLFMTKKRNPLYIWSGRPPKLSEILKEVQRHLSCNKSLITMNWLDQYVKISLKESKGRRYPVSQCLVQGFICSSQPYFLWHGKWLKICLEYQNLINQNFFSILNENTIKAEVMFPLPWENKTSEEDSKADETKSVFKLEEFTSFLNILGPSNWSDDSAKSLLNKLGMYDQSEGNCIYKPDDYNAELNNKHQNANAAGTDNDFMADVVVFAKIFIRLHARISEFTFNKTYLLLDQVLRRQSSNIRFIVVDQLLSHQVELFDVLAFNEMDTYLVHVKTGFDHNVRVACSQVRNSADQLFNDFTTSKSLRILDHWWYEIHKPIKTKARAKYRKAVQESCSLLGKEGFQALFEMPRSITFVLAIKDTKKEYSALRFEEGHFANLEECIEEAVGDNSDFVLKKLKEKEYVMKDKSYSVSDKFVMKAEKDNFADEMYSSTKTTGMKCSGVTHTRKQKLRKKDWEEVYDALKKQVPKTKSTVVQMELLHLFSYFRKFQIGSQKFQLKICFIPDSNANLGEDLKTFLYEKA